MCDPVSIGMAAVGVIGAVHQNNMAQDAADAQNAMYAANRDNSFDAMRTDYESTQMRQSQEQDAASQKKAERERQERKELSSASVAAAEGGVSGFSVDAIMADISAMSDRDISSIDRNKDWNIAQLGNEMAGIRNTTQSRINSVGRGTAPSGLSMGLNIASAGLNSASSYQARTGKNLFGS